MFNYRRQSDWFIINNALQSHEMSGSTIHPIHTYSTLLVTKGYVMSSGIVTYMYMYKIHVLSKVYLPRLHDKHDVMEST